MYYYYLTSKDRIIRVWAKQKPSIHRTPKSGTWIVQEWEGEHWEMPCFPEITLEKLKQMIYLGKAPKQESEDKTTYIRLRRKKK